MAPDNLIRRLLPVTGRVGKTIGKVVKQSPYQARLYHFSPTPRFFPEQNPKNGERDRNRTRFSGGNWRGKPRTRCNRGKEGAAYRGAGKRPGEGRKTAPILENRDPVLIGKSLIDSGMRIDLRFFRKNF